MKNRHRTHKGKLITDVAKKRILVDKNAIMHKRPLRAFQTNPFSQTLILQSVRNYNFLSCFSFLNKVQSSCPWKAAKEIVHGRTALPWKQMDFLVEKQCVFKPSNDNSYAPTALGSYVWTATEVTIFDGYIFMYP